MTLRVSRNGVYNCMQPISKGYAKRLHSAQGGQYWWKMKPIYNVNQNISIFA